MQSSEYKDKLENSRSAYKDRSHLDYKDKSQAEYKDKSQALSTSRDQLRFWSIRYIVTISFVWIALVYYYERHHISNAFAKCSWDSWENSGSEKHRILLVADPQIVDDYSYPGQPRILNYVVKKITDNYLRRNYLFAHKSLAPNTTIFLGDLFDGGREWNDHDWNKEYIRYRSIFPSMKNLYAPSSSFEVYDLIPGNHDIGFQSINVTVRNRFSKHFGPPNRVLDIGGHHIVFIDTISYSHPDKEVSKESHEFLASLPKLIGSSKKPRILMSHVPLYRDPALKPCGPDREKPGKFPLMKGVQYQTIIEHDFTFQILEVVNPVIIFAGDDHDYCDISQEFKYHETDRVAREITVKSSAMSGGIKRPAVQLLSLLKSHDPQAEVDAATHATKMCFLPDPFATFKLFLVAMMVLFLGLVYAIRRERPRQTLKSSLTWILARLAMAGVSFLLILSYFYASV